VNFLSTFLTKSPAIPQQLYKTASHSLSAIAELLVFSKKEHHYCLISISGLIAQ